jgi:hypothetical protein
MRGTSMQRLPSPISLPNGRMTGGRASRHPIKPMTFPITVHATLQKDLQLSKKLVRWAIKLLYEEMKKE